MVNTNKLKGAMVQAGYNQNTLAERLNMSKNTLSAKLNGKTKISVDEACEMCKILNIEGTQLKCEIFLS